MQLSPRRARATGPPWSPAWVAPRSLGSRRRPERRDLQERAPRCLSGPEPTRTPPPPRSSCGRCSGSTACRSSPRASTPTSSPPRPTMRPAAAPSTWPPTPAAGSSAPRPCGAPVPPAARSAGSSCFPRRAGTAPAGRCWTRCSPARPGHADHPAPLRSGDPDVRAGRLPAGRLDAPAPRRPRPGLRARPRRTGHPGPTGGPPPPTSHPSPCRLMDSQRLPERSDEQPFAYQDGVLHVGGLPLDQAVAATGTPAYVYDLDAIAAAWRRVASAFQPLGGEALYAVKANSNLAVLSRLASSGAGFDVVSGGELLRVLRAGGDPARTVF